MKRTPAQSRVTIIYLHRQVVYAELNLPAKEQDLFSFRKFSELAPDQSYYSGEVVTLVIYYLKTGDLPLTQP
jgi:hypothetical protein